ncbi:histidine phosphatase family protein [Kitasatospora mediocidica]|uniref:histidine phosphatase family protein n=1 Tax=Kitasatospora mediocidica TaxID=58352 RepID=UPI00068AC12B|nr:histidine phosphatase family protein [Kitasatospora mediocidica]
MDSGTRLLLVRHGQARVNVERIIGGPLGCTGLTERGRADARRLGARIAAEKTGVDTLLCSPLPRARETAELISERIGLPVHREDEGLIELKPGAADGLTSDAFDERYGRFDMTLEPDRPVAPGGESWSALRTRALDTLHRLERDFRGQRVLCVSHGVFIAAAVVSLLGIPRTGNDTRLSPDWTSVTEFTHDGTRWHLNRYNDHAHVPTGADY